MAISTFETLTDFGRLEKPVRQHLKNVYSTLSICMIAAAAGAYVHLFIYPAGGILTALTSIGLLVYLGTIQHSPRNNQKRVMLMLGFALFTGMGLGPLMDIVIRINPSIIPTAFIATSTVFACLSLAAVYSDDRKFLYLGGFLTSALSWLLMMGLANLFFRSQLLFQVEMYVGLLVMCGFVLYDTQLIIQKKRMGSDDFIWHGIELFIDFINLFRRIMILLANKENDKNKRRN